MRLGNEGVQNWRIGLYGIRAECLKVEANGRLTIRQCGVVRIALPDHSALKTERVGYISIGVLLYNDLPSLHAIKLIPPA